MGNVTLKITYLVQVCPQSGWPHCVFLGRCERPYRWQPSPVGACRAVGWGERRGNMFHHCAADGWRGRILLSKRPALLQRAPGKTTPPTGAQGHQDTTKQQPNSKTIVIWFCTFWLLWKWADLHIQRVVTMTMTAQFLRRRILKYQFLLR